MNDERRMQILRQILQLSFEYLDLTDGEAVPSAEQDELLIFRGTSQAMTEYDSEDVQDAA